MQYKYLKYKKKYLDALYRQLYGGVLNTTPHQIFLSCQVTFETINKLHEIYEQSVNSYVIWGVPPFNLKILRFLILINLFYDYSLNDFDKLNMKSSITSAIKDLNIDIPDKAVVYNKIFDSEKFKSEKSNENTKRKDFEKLRENYKQLLEKIKSKLDSDKSQNADSLNILNLIINSIVSSGNMGKKHRNVLTDKIKYITGDTTIREEIIESIEKINNDLFRGMEINFVNYATPGTLRLELLKYSTPDYKLELDNYPFTLLKDIIFFKSKTDESFKDPIKLFEEFNEISQYIKKDNLNAKEENDCIIIFAIILIRNLLFLYYYMRELFPEHYDKLLSVINTNKDDARAIIKKYIDNYNGIPESEDIYTEFSRRLGDICDVITTNERFKGILKSNSKTITMNNIMPFLVQICVIRAFYYLFREIDKYKKNIFNRKIYEKYKDKFSEAEYKKLFLYIENTIKYYAELKDEDQEDKEKQEQFKLNNNEYLVLVSELTKFDSYNQTYVNPNDLVSRTLKLPSSLSFRTTPSDIITSIVQYADKGLSLNETSSEVVDLSSQIDNLINIPIPYFIHYIVIDGELDDLICLIFIISCNIKFNFENRANYKMRVYFQVPPNIDDKYRNILVRLFEAISNTYKNLNGEKLIELDSFKFIFKDSFSINGSKLMFNHVYNKLKEQNENEILQKVYEEFNNNMKIFNFKLLNKKFKELTS